MEKKYQVFVSSTYDDLKEERQEVMKALLELDCIPVGMELFSANDNDQWTLIQSIIKECDYYIVIIAGKYGSLHSSGISYTEMEYKFAVSSGLPIIGFLHRYPERLSHDKCESDPVKVKKLSEFKNFVQQRLIQFWESPADLGGKASRSLVRLKNTHPRTGWVKADKLASDETIKRVFTLTDEVDSLTKENEKLKKNESQFKDIIRNIIASFGNTIKDTKNVLYNEMFSAVELSYKYSVDNLNNILDSSLQIITDSLALIIKNQLKTKNIDEQISVSIKAFVDESNAKKILEDTNDEISNINNKNSNERFIITLARDSETLKNYPHREVKKSKFKVGRNSDFNRILSGEEYFISNDLLSAMDENGYINESPNWQSNYNATAVVPIYYLAKDSDEKQIFGFLSVDSLNKNNIQKFFTKKDTIPVLEFGAELLTIIF